MQLDATLEYYLDLLCFNFQTYRPVAKEITLLWQKRESIVPIILTKSRQDISQILLDLQKNPANQNRSIKVIRQVQLPEHYLYYLQAQSKSEI